MTSRMLTSETETPGDHIRYRASLLAALAYGDLFDYPLTLRELERYQAGTRLSSEDIGRLMAVDDELRKHTTSIGDYYCLRGREDTIPIRLRRKSIASTLWPRAHTWARLLARLPYVRMVAVTGSLAVDNVSGRPDIDFMVVAEPGRVWICRRLLVLCVRLARLTGDQICPNFVLSTRRLALAQRDFFTAHEMAQMVPVYGLDVYEELVLSNLWALRYLPCGLTGSLGQESGVAAPGRLRSLAERVLKHSLFDRWERWEMLRLSSHLKEASAEGEVVCSPEECKGHTSLHREATMSRYTARVAELDLLEEVAHLFVPYDDEQPETASVLKAS